MPVSGCVLPIVIVLSVTPGAELPLPPPPPLLPPPQPAAASASTAPPASRRMWELRIVPPWGSGWSFKRNLPGWFHESDEASDRADDAAGSDQHDEGEKDAVDQQGQVVGDLLRADRE